MTDKSRIVLIKFQSSKLKLDRKHTMQTLHVRQVLIHRRENWILLPKTALPLRRIYSQGTEDCRDIIEFPSIFPTFRTTHFVVLHGSALLTFNWSLTGIQEMFHC